MTRTQHKNARLAFASLVPLFFVTGFGAGILLIPVSIAEFAEQGVLWIICAVLLTPFVQGVFSVLMLLLGFPLYLLLAKLRGGYSVDLVQGETPRSNTEQAR
jgi:hypothetical protein